MDIGEVAKRSGVPASALRYYEQRGLIASNGRQGLRRTWRHACRLEGIDPKNPDRLPRLFAIDVLLAIPDGFRYDLDCARKDGTAGGADSFCASGFGCGGSGCGGDGDAADGGDGGGDGGGGCGGD